MTCRRSTGRTCRSRTSTGSAGSRAGRRPRASTARGCGSPPRGHLRAASGVYAPAQDDYDHAELILDAYEWHTSAAGGMRGAVMLGDEMIDEASRKMALVVAAKGRAAGMTRTSSFEAP